ncbi:MAG: MarR family transcriptional regulator [Clostridiales bacterium]|nr:MarR family transcriptional regulator [Clostridiales bacterium]
MQLEDSIHFLLTVSQHTVFQRLSRELTPYDITPSQYGVLSCLWSAGGVCFPRQIAETLSLETSTVSGILDRMQRKELITRGINQDNRREIFVSMTEKGEALREPLQKIVENLNDEMLQGFTEEERAFLKKALLRMAEREA